MAVVIADPFQNEHPFVRYTSQAVNAASKLVEGVDAATKLTKFAKAIFVVLGKLWESLATYWKPLADHFGTFADVNDFLSVIVSGKDIVDLARGTVSGWMQQAAKVCFIAFRFMITAKFLHNVKLLDLGVILDKKMGRIPVFGTVMNLFVIAGLTFFTIENIKKLASPEEAAVTAAADLAAAEWSILSAQYAGTIAPGARPVLAIPNEVAAYKEAFVARFAPILRAPRADLLNAADAKITNIIASQPFNVMLPPIGPAIAGPVPQNEVDVARNLTIARFTRAAKESAKMRRIETCSLIIDTIDKIVKIVFLILLIVGSCGVACLAVMSWPMVILAAVSAGIGLTKIVFDKLCKDEKPKLREPFPQETLYLHQDSIDLFQRYQNQRIGQSW